MNTRDYFKDMYTDFFGIESQPKIEVKEKSKEESQEEMTSLFVSINDLYISDSSKETLKKIIEYMRKYSEGIEKNYIPFNLILSVDNDELETKITDILFKAGTYFKYINNKKKEITAYKLDNNFDSDLGLIIFNNLSGINLEEDKNSKIFIHNFNEFIEDNNKAITIISGNQNELDNFFLGREDFKKYFTLEIKGINPDCQDIYAYVKENVSDIDDVKLLDYITATYKNDVNYYKYQNDLVKYISFNKCLPNIEQEKTIEEIFKDLDELVGLTKVKTILRELVDVIELKKKAGDDLKIKDINLHMVFLGNPGTGKTTIARLIKDILYNLKYIKEDKLIEVSVKDLVAEYVGQTAPKTMSVIEKAMNGVLFIDEAYTLASTKDNSYNDEAIATLIQAMENYRDKLVVIFAGYTKEMQGFLNSNSGIASRIGYTIEFEDYTTTELIEIFKGFTTKAGFIVEDEAITYLEEIINKYRNMKNFGNARFIRNIYEKTVIKHASNVKDKKQKKILKTITKNDISIDSLILE